MDFLDLTGKVALVTGAAGAIGKGVAAEFCAHGAKAFITDINQDAVDAVVAEITAAGGTCAGLAGDVTVEEQVQAVVAAAADAFGGKVDILVNVAGIIRTNKIEETTVETWDHVFAVNCKGTFLFAKHTVPLMKKGGFGRIINYSSKSGKTGSALMCHYSGAKAAIIGMTHSLAYELAKDNITANCICPGITEATGVWTDVSSGYVRDMDLTEEEIVKRFTAKVPLGRLARIADVVAMTVFLASSGADYMTGQAINVTGGREMH